MNEDRGAISSGSFVEPALRHCSLEPCRPASRQSNGTMRPVRQKRKRLAGKFPTCACLSNCIASFRRSVISRSACKEGRVLELAQCPAIGVDPSPDINRELPSTTIVLALTSDDFFSRHAEGVTPDLSFIDGMHLFEYALRDFMNVERRAAPGAVVVLDGVLPNHPAQARRDRQTREWTGDIWRVADVLKRRRSDLFVLPIDAAPAGLLLVAGLDQANRVLWDHYNPIVREAAAEARPPPEVIARLEAVDPAGPVFRQVLDALKAARADHCLPHQIVARIREALPDPTQAESAR